MKVFSIAIALVGVLCTSSLVSALPRFAARNGNECIQCHVNPTGGGMRNAYGRNIFERQWLAFDSGQDGDFWENGEEDDAGAKAEEDKVLFDPEINDWFALGGDFRTAYIMIRPQRGREWRAKKGDYEFLLFDAGRPLPRHDTQ